ncbi:hypothetical protein ACE7GA_11920 [Roseomonas sp. CCTCC AB2023176]|uniref:hypothetical protein n=1 Tax=Roseomonas sp. CCTCC AB2023176 TaxID=3342640 RepID=UPI0035DF1772
MHDLHVWALGTTETAVTAHLVRGAAADPDAILVAATEVARARGIGHATFQVEMAATADLCAGCAA